MFNFLFYMLKLKKKYNSFIVQSFKHEQLIKLVTSFQKDINKLITYINQLLYSKFFNLKVLLLRKLLFFRNINLSSFDLYFNENSIFFVIKSFLIQYSNCFYVFCFRGSAFFMLSRLFYSSGVFFFSVFDIVAIYSAFFLHSIFSVVICLQILSVNTFFFFISFFAHCLLFFFSVSINFASLPNKVVKFTVLKSPHTDKKSREQFELKTYKKVLSYPYFFFDFYNYLFYHKHISFACNITHNLFDYKHG